MPVSMFVTVTATPGMTAAAFVSDGALNCSELLLRAAVGREQQKEHGDREAECQGTV